ncbi:MAG: ABC transporter ATP-binding protein [Alphaproteobacteria bacterium]
MMLLPEKTEDGGRNLRYDRVASILGNILQPPIEFGMQRVRTAPLSFGDQLSQAFVRVMRLDARPAIQPLPEGYAERRALPFLFDIVRSMLLGRALLVVIAAVLSQVLFSLQPYGLSRLIDSLSVSLGSHPDAPDDVALWVAMLFVFWIGGPFFFQLAQLVQVYLGPTLRVAIKARLFQYLMGHAPHFFQVNLPGRLAQKVTQAANSGQSVLFMLTIEGVQSVALVIVASALLGSLSLVYGTVLAIWMVVFMLLTASVGRFGIHLERSVQNEISKVSGRLVDTINNWELVRGFARLDHERHSLVGPLRRECSVSRRARLFLVGISVFHTVLGVVLMIWLVFSAIADTRAGVMTIGEFTMVTTLGMNVVMVVRMMGRRLVDFFADYGALRDGIELIMSPHAMPDRPRAGALTVHRGAIAFENVTFSYPDGTRVFEGLSLAIRPGEKVGLVGASGAGKSTIIRLLTRQFLPDAGRITIDGQDIAGVTQASLCEAIGEVGQVPNVFHRSVGDNIAYGAPDADEAAIWQAARAAHCDGFITQRGEGLGTLVGERGLKLSGGERQRLAIARAFLKNAPILVLDEATSSLDSEVEAAIQDSLMHLMRGRTVIAIAHRLSTIVGMDRLLVLEAGRLVEEGTHHQLLARGGVYAAFWDRQTRHARADGNLVRGVGKATLDVR